MIELEFSFLYVLYQCSKDQEFYGNTHPEVLFDAFTPLRPVCLTESTMLVIMLEIQNLYESFFSRHATDSTCFVKGNISQGTIFIGLYPFFLRISISRF